jgi:tubulin polyglutamylase TTLL9
MKRRRRALEKEGRLEEGAAYNFIPTTFVLPKEYSMFVEEFKKVGGVWIMKPIGSAQGKGIFLFTRLSEISEWKTDYKSIKGTNATSGRGKEDEKEVEAYVVQRYLQYPLLIGGKKFDMRLYALVTSFSPLKVFQYRRGFARFTNSRYSSKIEDIYNKGIKSGAASGKLLGAGGGGFMMFYVLKNKQKNFIKQMKKYLPTYVEIDYRGTTQIVKD